MKKLVIIMIALMTAMQAQAGLLPSLRWGIKGGMDYQVNDFKSAAENIDIKSNTGWYAGAHATLSWGMIGIRPELIYSQNKFNLLNSSVPAKLKPTHLLHNSVGHAYNSKIIPLIISCHYIAAFMASFSTISSFRTETVIKIHLFISCTILFYRKRSDII